MGTPLRSGTIFGHLCWAMRHLDGEQRLIQWLGELEADPFEISDGFPVGFLPRPLLRPAARECTRGSLQDSKKTKRSAWVSLEAFLGFRAELNEPRLMAQLAPEQVAGERKVRIAHNTINRRTGRTPEEGGLYFMEETWPKSGAEYDVYVRTSMPAAQLSQLIAHVGQWGYGRDSTLGRGRFTAAVEEAGARLLQCPGANRLLSLSHGAFTENMRDARYKLHTHYGRTGSTWAAGDPFKYPITLLRPGATFAGEGAGPYGKLLRGVHPKRHEVVENAWHLAIPYREVEA